jgi:hypothetical protein
LAFVMACYVLHVSLDDSCHGIAAVHVAHCQGVSA